MREKFLSIFLALMVAFSGLMAQQLDAETMNKKRAEKRAAELAEKQNPVEYNAPNVTKDDILMQNGEVTTCDAMFYDTGGSSANYQSDESLTLTMLPATGGSMIMVTFTAFDIENNYEHLKIYDGTDASATMLADLTGATLPVDPFLASNPDGALTFVFTADGSVTKPGWAATVECYTQLDNNLGAVDLLGSAFGTEGVEKTMSLIVKNWGSADVVAADYTVTLVDDNENVLATATGIDLLTGTQDTIDLLWTPAAAGAISVKGVVNYVEDGNLDNNETDLMAIEIMPAGTHVAQVGSDATFPPSRVPFDFYFKNSASQTIYTSEQLGIGGGALLSIAYKNNFATDLSAGKPVKVWIGETSDVDLSAGWIDPSTLTLVYDDVLSLPAGENDIQITLNAPYIYQGGNLVIYTYRVWEDEYFSSSDKFYGSEVATAQTRRNSSDTEFSSTLEGVAGTTITWVPNTTLFFSTAGLGGIEGTVSSEGNPLEGVTVQIVDAFGNTTTDASGYYIFPLLLPETVDLAFSKHGFEPDTLVGVEILAEDTITVDAVLTPIPTYMVSGIVKASDTDAGVDGAVVTLVGYENYVDTTDATGAFEFTGVYGDNREYVVTASFDGYTNAVDTVDVIDADLTALELVVNEIAYPVALQSVELNASDEAVVTWAEPGSLIPSEFRFDNGVQTGQLGSGSGTNNTVLGAVHRVNAQVHEVSWFTTDESGPHATVNVFLFDLDGSGAPTGTVLYSAMGVANTDMVWMNHVLPEPVDAPNGFMVAISYAGFAALGTTTPDDDYPLVPMTQCYSMDYTAGGFDYVENLGDPTLENNFMIRAYGYDMGKTAIPAFAHGKARKANHKLELISNKPVQTDNPIYSLINGNAKVLVDYSIYRLNEGQDEAEWTEMATGVVDTFYVDNTWAALEYGLYQYAIVANYTNGVMSDPKLTNVLAKDMTVAYTVNITTNASDDASDALVTLTNQDGEEEHVYTMTADASGAAFAEVWRGTYDITVTKAGFEPYVANDISIMEDGLSIDIELVEIIAAPYGLMIMQEAGDANFSWNNAMGFTDDFESYDDFVLDFSPWTTVDVDGIATYGFQGVTFPNSGTANAGIIFNPSTTTPAIETSPAYSGSKYLAVFNPGDASPCDDWVISPQTTIMPDGQVSFWARGGNAEYSAERFQVFVSTTDADPASFTAISAIETCAAGSVEWVHYSYSLADYAGQNVYVGIHITSVDQFYFCLDDFSIESAKAKGAKAFEGFTVYLDGNEEAAGLTETNYLFEDLGVGSYTAGVKAVYETGESEIVTIDFEILPEATFIVKDEADNFMEGATVTVGGNDYTTDANGEATMMMAVGSHPYTVSMAGYYDATGTLVIEDGMASISETVTLLEMMYTVTFTARNSATNAALEGVTITINEVDLTTDASGIATIDLLNGDYPFTATLDNYADIMESVTVNGAAVNYPLNMVGMSDVAQTGFTIYPNPTTGVLNVTAQGTNNVVVLNAIGQVVHTQVLNGNGTIDLSNNASGVYFVRFQSGNNVATQRVILE